MAKIAVENLSNQELGDLFYNLLGGSPEPEITRENTALMVIDVQYVDAHPDYGIGARAKEPDMEGVLDYYWSRCSEVMLPNIQRLLSAARKTGIEVIHVRLATQTQDGRDGGRIFESKGVAPTPQSKDAEFLPEVAPVGDELVIGKTTSSVFNSTNIDRILRNMGIENLIIAGVVTNGCVYSSTHSAVEHDYGTIVVEDATAAFAPQIHEAAILNMHHQQVAFIRSTEEMVKKIQAL
jgi:nicotinamidase-related amidase